MGKRSRRKIKNYEIYKDYEYGYYGLLPRKNKLRVDVIRFKKTTFLRDDALLSELNKPRTTVYFIPHKRNRYDYNINYFRDVVSNIHNEWNSEFKPLINSIKTPEQAESDEYGGYWMATGIMEYDEVSMHARMQRVRRAYEYEKILRSFHAQFLHQFASSIESIMVFIFRKNSHNLERFTRNELSTLFLKKTKKKIQKLNNYMYYDQFYRLWNFLKHSSISAYNKLRDSYPEFLIEPEKNKYENGQLAVGFTKIDEDTIKHFVEKLPLFFEEFCEVLFDERVEYSTWNYDDWFYSRARENIENIYNPLGLPPWI